LATLAAVLRLTDAWAICYRFFDVADSIHLEKARELLSRAGSGVRRVGFSRAGSAYLQLSNAPLAADLGARQLEVLGKVRDVQLGLRLFDHGCLAIALRVPLEPGQTLAEVTPFADELYDSRAIDGLARDEIARLRTQLEPAFEKPHLWDQHEEYTVLFVKAFDRKATADEVLAEPGLAKLLLGEVDTATLSQRESKEVLEHHHSYTTEDLALCEWNATFLYEPSGSEDIVDLLEIANAQLLELRYYDAVLDTELTRVYDGIDLNKGSILYSPYRKVLRELMQTLIELSEFIERVENALKIVGDVYLARVYESAVGQLRVKQWTEQVSRKHRLLLQTYQLLKGEVDHARSLTLELMVVVLILLEILMALVQVRGH
jgi:hypothetical protein